MVKKSKDLAAIAENGTIDNVTNIEDIKKKQKKTEDDLAEQQEKIRVIEKRATALLLGNVRTEEIQHFIEYLVEREGLEYSIANKIIQDVLVNHKTLKDRPYVYMKTTMNRLGYFVGEARIDTSRLAEYVVDKYNIKMIEDEETGSSQAYYYRYGVYKILNNISTLAYREIRGTVADAHEKAEKAERAIRTIINDSQTYTIETSKQRTDIINFINGLYDWKSGKFHAHSPNVFSLIQIPHKLNIKNNKIDEWMRFLNKACEGKTENMAIIQEMMGYLLIPENLGKKIYILSGPKDTGKTVFVELLEYLLGIRNISKLTPESIEGDKFSLVRLNNKLVNISGDVNEANLGNAGKLKELSGGARTIETEKKGKDKQLNNFFAKFIIACNSVPKTYEVNSAFADRLVILEFINVIRDQDKDPLLLEKLKKEANGIFLWALEGLRRYISNSRRHSYSKHVEDAVMDYKEKNDNVVYFFNQHFEPAGERDYSNVMTTASLFTLYENFCHLNNLQPVDRLKFREILQNKIDYIKYIKKASRNVRQKPTDDFERKTIADAFYGFIDEGHVIDQIKLK